MTRILLFTLMLFFAKSGFAQQTLSITPTLHLHSDNLEAVCQSTFGPQAYLADWNDIVAIPNIVQWADSIGFFYNQEIYLRYNGAYFYSANRHYFMARHNNIYPSGWLIHATINNNFIDVGSWNGLRYVMCKNTQAAPVLGCTDPTSCDYNPAASEGGVELCFTYPGDSCDDGDPATVNDLVAENCDCVGQISGCTNPNSCEYNPLAVIDDGSCISFSIATPIFHFTSSSFTELADPNQQCINEFGPNYALADWTQLEQISNIVQWADSIGIDPYQVFWVQNNGQEFWNGSNRHYLVQRQDGVPPGDWGGYDDINNSFLALGSWYGLVQPALCATSCVLEIEGCMIPEACNYNPVANIASNDCLLPDGCTDSLACNYNPLATCDDGSCQLPDGCTDVNACNFDPFAVCDNGGCAYIIDCSGVCGGDYMLDPCGNCFDPNLPAPSCVQGCTNPLSCDYNPIANLSDDALCTVFPGDSCDDNDPSTINDAYNQNCDCVGEQTGCTNPQSCEYNPLATIDDGSCATILSNQTVYQLTSTFFTEQADPNQQCINEFGPNYSLADWTDLEQIPNIVQWADSLQMPSNIQIWVQNNGQEYWNGGNRHFLIQRHNGSLPGGWLAHDNINNYFISLGSFYNILNPALCASSCVPDMSGCIDPLACNYDENALEDDGSCSYALAGYDCIGNCLADSDGDGVCDQNEVPGCTDPNACNYNPEATDPGGVVTVSFSSTVTSANGGNLPAGIQNGDNATLSFEVNVNDWALDAGFSGLNTCEVPFWQNAIFEGCDIKAYSAQQPVSYAMTYTSGFVEVLTFDRMVFVDGGTEINFDFQSENPRGDAFYLYLGNKQVFEIGEFYGNYLNGIVDNLYFLLNTLDTAPFQLSYYWANINSGWTTYHYDYTTPAGFADVSVVATEACIAFDDAVFDCDGNCLFDSDQDGICDQLELAGCTDDQSCNYDPFATDDDGSCLVYPGDSCDDGNPQTVNDTVDEACMCLGVVLGCTDNDACNYNEAATQDDGSCEYPNQGYDCIGNCLADSDGDGICDQNEVPGCTDPNACNYSPDATDQGGMVTVAFSSTVTSANGGNLPAGIQNGDNATLSFEVNVNDWTLDAGFSGLNTCDVPFWQNAIFEGCDIKAYSSQQPVSYAMSYTSGFVEVLTFDRMVFVDGGTEINFDFQSENPRGDAFYLYLGNQQVFEIGEFYGNYLNGIVDNLYFLLNTLDTAPFQLSYYWANINSGWTTYHYDYTTPAGFADVTVENQVNCDFSNDPVLDCDGLCINDTDQDGVCDENEILGCTDSNASNYDPLATDDDDTCSYDVLGCTDQLACNFDPAATADNGQCDFDSCVGCTNEIAANYNEAATIDDGSCIVFGCLVTFACNYNPNANTDDGSCENNSCAGCTYPAALNYDPNATIDNGSCIFLELVYGCMNPDALNYDPSATADNGSCLFESDPQGCTYPDAANYDPAAVDDNGSCIFVTNDCPSDFNQDGVINVGDLIVFLATLGTTCD